VAGGGGSFGGNFSGDGAYGLLIGTPSLDVSLGWTNEITNALRDFGYGPASMASSLKDFCSK
jgi:hypothetical protein